jgi:hypothetical protein
MCDWSVGTSLMWPSLLGSTLLVCTVESLINNLPPSAGSIHPSHPSIWGLPGPNLVEDPPTLPYNPPYHFPRLTPSMSIFKAAVMDPHPMDLRTSNYLDKSIVRGIMPSVLSWIHSNHSTKASSKSMDLARLPSFF